MTGRRNRSRSSRANQLFVVFCKQIAGLFDTHFSVVHAGIASGRSNIPSAAVSLYPSILIATETDDHYVVELTGATDSFSHLRVTRHKENSTSRYLSRFYDDAISPMVTVDTAYMCWKSIPFVDDADFGILAARFPVLTGLESRYRLLRKTGDGCLLRLGQMVEALLMVDCLFVHRRGNAFSVRNPSLLLIVSKTTPWTSVSEFLSNSMNPTKNLWGLSLVARHTAQAVLQAGQLQSLFMIPDVRETTVGMFLRDHPDILCRAFAATELIYEPYCEWQCDPPDPGDKAINPDIFLKRPNGDCDIFDLKRPLLSKDSITKGESRRRRFIDYVAEGIAQLAHYRAYLSIEKNRRYVEQRFGLRIREPRFLLIVGFYENVVLDHVKQAGRSVDDIDVIDYDTVVQMYLTAVTQDGDSVSA